MKLSEWLEHTGTDPADFASRINTTPMSVSRYLSGKRIPDRAIMPRIKTVTGGAVTADDFYDLNGHAPTRCNGNGENAEASE